MDLISIVPTYVLLDLILHTLMYLLYLYGTGGRTPVRTYLLPLMVASKYKKKTKKTNYNLCRVRSERGFFGSGRVQLVCSLMGAILPQPIVSSVCATELRSNVLVHMDTHVLLVRPSIRPMVHSAFQFTYIHKYTYKIYVRSASMYIYFRKNTWHIDIYKGQALC